MLWDSQRCARRGLAQEFAFPAEFRRCRDGMQESRAHLVGIQLAEEDADLVTPSVGKGCPVGPPVVNGDVALRLLL